MYTHPLWIRRFFRVKGLLSLFTTRDVEHDLKLNANTLNCVSDAEFGKQIFKVDDFTLLWNRHLLFELQKELNANTRLESHIIM